MLKKWMIILVIFTLGGCTLFDQEDKVLTQKMQRYQAYYTSIFDNDRFIDYSDFYDIEFFLNELPDRTYRYDLIIDNPRIAMYDVEVMIVENDTDPEDIDKMMPNAGIFEDAEYNLVPFQFNSDKGYRKGIALSGIVDQPVVTLRVMVAWKDYAKVNSTREFFLIQRDFNAPTVIPGDVDNDVDMDDEDDDETE